jgi:hypothetical protein
MLFIVFSRFDRKQQMALAMKPTVDSPSHGFIRVTKGGKKMKKIKSMTITAAAINKVKKQKQKIVIAQGRPENFFEIIHLRISAEHTPNAFLFQATRVAPRLQQTLDNNNNNTESFESGNHRYYGHFARIDVNTGSVLPVSENMPFPSMRLNVLDSSVFLHVRENVASQIVLSQSDLLVACVTKFADTDTGEKPLGWTSFHTHLAEFSLQTRQLSSTTDSTPHRFANSFLSRDEDMEVRRKTRQLFGNALRLESLFHNV